MPDSVSPLKKQKNEKPKQPKTTKLNNMKISIKIAAALLALGIVSEASADPTVYLTGSTAFRATAYKALSASFPTNNAAEVFDSNTVTQVTYGNSSAGSANYMLFHGNINGSGVFIDCRWSGSEAGIASACNTSLANKDRNGTTIALAGSPALWLDVSQFSAPLSGAVVGTNPPNSLLEFGGDTSQAHGADLAQADTSQGVSWTPNLGSGQTALKSYGIEGIVTFVFCKNYQSAATLTAAPAAAAQAYNDLNNISIPQIYALLSQGKLTSGFLTGNTNDTIKVYAVGRNLGSGTRMNTLSDTTYGPHNGVSQYSIGAGVQPGEAQTETLAITNEANNGYESGGGVAEALDIDGSLDQTDPIVGGTGWMAVGYAGPSDVYPSAPTGTVPNPMGPSNWLTLGGVAASNGTIENGQYEFWGSEHLYGKNGISGIQDTVGSKLYSGIVAQIALAGYGTNSAILDPAIPLTAMKASKSSDTAFPIPGTMTQFKY
jgi:hypothetical protein